MQVPLQLDRASGEPLQSQLAAQLRNLILSGRIRPGASIPSSRELANLLNVSRNTVIAAYERLSTEGYIESSRASGTFVSKNVLAAPVREAEAEDRDAQVQASSERRRDRLVFRGRPQRVINLDAPRPPIDFFVGRPHVQSFPRKTWRRLLLKNIAIGAYGLAEYSDPAGLLDLRQAIADHLGPARGIRTTAAQIIITGGIQEALNVVSRLLIQPGTPVVIEDPCYQGAAFTFESYGAELIPTAVDLAGLQVRRLPERAVSVAYVTPSHQFPVGATMPLNRRLQLLEWANRVGAYIVEDDYDSDFRYDGPPLTALAGMDSTGAVIYVGTFSKAIGAGLRVGYMVVPPELVQPACHVKTILNNGNGWLNQAALADFIRSGGYVRHLRRIQKENKSRLQALAKAVGESLPGATITGDQGGMHVMLHLPANGPTAPELETHIRPLGVGLYSLRSGAAIDFKNTRYSERGLVLGYSSLSEAQIMKGIARIGDAVAAWTTGQNVVAVAEAAPVLR